MNPPETGATDYRRLVYSRYRTAFKAANGDPPGAMGAQPKLAALLAPWLDGVDRSGEVLDLGCGDGSLLQTMRALGFRRLAGVDCSAEQVERARHICPDAVEGDLVRYLEEREAGRFPVILLFDVVEHLRKVEILHLMELIVTRLRPGGVFIGHCPNGDSPFVGTLHAGDFTHETLLNAQSARHLCTLFGLEAFEAKEHLGTSSNWKGRARSLGWHGLRAGLKVWNLIETGSTGSGIFTRQFAFKARRPR
jgi:2-polyprenyl-3-methyl-5-hydroxy-6-metoxy-1,4-benzoquinol methylase